MLKNYLKIAWRNLQKNRTFSLINILGLAAGLASFILISLYVWDELSYDRSHARAKDIYRIQSDIRFGGSDLSLATSADPMGAMLQKDYPSVEKFTRIYASEGSKMIRKGNEYINELAVAYADSTFFDVFSFKALAGNLRSALNEPNTVVITETAARKYFGTKDVLGKMVEVKADASELYKITGVVEALPRNSHFHFDFFLSMDNVDYGFGNFLSHNFHTYLLLRPDARAADLEKQFPTFINKYVLPQASQVMEVKSMAEFEKAGNQLSYSLIPLTDIHLHSNRHPELEVNGRIEYVWIFSAVALFILLLACINFMNLSTARSAARAREVGIRKVMGTSRNSLVAQFITESVLMVFVSLLIALGIIFLVLPLFNEMSSKDMQWSDIFKASFAPLLFAIPLVVGFFAGIYPAFFLSRFQPVKVLKGKQDGGLKKSNLRSALVIFQFATSIILIIATIVVYRQLNHIRTTDLGYQKEQVLVINNTYAIGSNVQAFKNEILKIKGVKAATMSSYLPVPSSRSDNTFSKDAVMDSRNSLNQQVWRVDHDYLPVLGMKMLKGRWFSRDFGADSSAIVINETSAALFGFDDPVGKKLYTGEDGTQAQNKAYTIIGVVKNFNFESLRNEVGPLAMRLGDAPYSGIFRIQSDQIPAMVEEMEQVWKKMGPSMAFSYQFLDQQFDNMYRAEQRMGNIGLSFAILAIFIACLGLFGLVTYMAEQRTKEIGVRKVLGASVADIVGLMSKEFLLLVVAASVIAFPVAYFVLNRWLQDYASRIQIGWWIYLLAGLATLLIALATIGMQSIKSALANPIKSLRSE
jgi:putative ABC transport system permease protein